jgi:Do/DeqQ family serine protease
MNRVLSALVLSGGVALIMGAPCLVLAGAPIPEMDGAPMHSIAPVVSRVTPGVVGISVRGRVREDNALLQDPLFRRFFNLQQQQPIERETQATGSGVIVDAAQGYVLTNSHVTENGNSIDVTTKDNRKFKARLIGRDPDTDIAVLQISGSNLTAVSMGDSDRLQVGDFVLAVGNPFGLGQTVTSGIVSALGRSPGIEGYEDFIQTDASINPGNSGGPLVDMQGRIIGINTAIVAPSGGNVGIGFAVPINMARQVMDQLISYGEIKRGRIGVAIQDLTPEVAQALGTTHTQGAVIARVEQGSPAESAGLRTNDLVVAVNGARINNGAELKTRVGLSKIGDALDLTIVRGASERTVAVRIDQFAAQRQRVRQR